MKKFNIKNLLIVAAFGLLSWLAYSNSLHNPFLMDDHALILQNRDIADIGHLQLNIFEKSEEGSSGANYVYFRPVTHLFDLVSYLLFKKDVFMYHVMNLCILFICGVILHTLLQRIGFREHVAFITTSFFLVHPINGVLINYTTTTGFLLLIFFSLIGFLCHLRYIEKGRRLFLALSYLLFSLSLLCHETAVMYPFYLAAILFFYRSFRLKRIALMLIPFITLIGIYLIFRMNYASLKAGVIDQISEFHISIWQFTAMFFNISLLYLKNLILLEDIALMWSSPVLSENLWLWNGAFLAVLMGLVCLIFKIWGKDPKSFALLWILIGLAPVSMACFSRRSMGFIISPHWLLISSIGFFLLIALFLDSFLQSKKRVIGIVGVCLMLTWYVTASRHYNTIWGNEIRYCKYMLDMSPNMTLIRFWLANAYMRAGALDKASEEFRQTIKGTYSDWTTFTNLGIIAGKLDRKHEELKYYLAAQQLNPDSVDLLNNIGAVYIHLDQFDKAEKYLLKALEMETEFIEPMKNLSVLYVTQNRLGEAIHILERVIQVEPNDEYSLRMLRTLKSPAK